MYEATYKVTIDGRNRKAMFTDETNDQSEYTVYDTSPESIAQLYRYAASHFLELAFQAEYHQGFSAPAYSDSMAAEQAQMLLRENVSIF